MVSISQTGFLRRAGILAIATALFGVAGCFAQLSNPVPVSPPYPAPTNNSEIAWFWTGRTGYNPANGQFLQFGYMTILNGSNSGIFNGTPGEGTAYFTFRYSVFQAIALPGVIDQNFFLTYPSTVNIYYNANPSGNWNNPDSFSSGQLVATYTRPESQIEQIYVSQFHEFSASLVSSTPFTFQGQTIDFGQIAPGVTIGDYLGFIPTVGFSPAFPLVYADSSYALVTHKVQVSPTTSAIASPVHATALARDFRLDGSKSTSAVAAQLQYQWTLAPGSPLAVIVDGNSATPTVRFDDPGNYVFRLQVTDANGNSSADFATVKYISRTQTK